LKPVIGKWGLHETSNGNGIRATDFVNINNTVIKRFILATQNIQKGTLKFPAARTNNQMEHVLADGSHASSIMLEIVEVQA
jgi:hypothetical protein